MCVFRDALLHTTVEMGGYLHYFHLPVNFDLSGPSLINKAFPCRTCCSLVVFCTTLSKVYRLLCVKIPGDQQFF